MKRLENGENFCSPLDDIYYDVLNIREILFYIYVKMRELVKKQKKDEYVAYEDN